MDEIAKKHQAIREEFFYEILKLLENNSWSQELIDFAEANLGLNKGYRYIVFPEGLKQIVILLEEYLDAKMLEALSYMVAPQKIRDKISLALEVRIMNVISKKAALACAGYYLLPNNMITSSKVSCNTCNIIWRYAGDKSTDFNYYTKRGLLLGVYIAARSFYFEDNSPDYQDTKKFIKNALDNIINIASFKNNIKLPKIEDIPIIRLFS